jgi:hypothetical protein
MKGGTKGKVQRNKTWNLKGTFLNGHNRMATKETLKRKSREKHKYLLNILKTS